jgi:D-3-phosphoglycerate dehydrogenase
MVVMAVDLVDVPAIERESLGLAFFGGVQDLDRVLVEADYVSLHVPLTPATRGLVGRRELSLLKPTAVLVNVARGALVDEAALVETLERRQIGGAGLDVFAAEPIDPDHPLLRLDTVVATPHNGVVSRELSLRRADVALENVERVVGGLPPLFLVHPAARA